MDSPDRHGHFRLLVEITPDHLRQQHVFEFEIDQSHLSQFWSRDKNTISGTGLTNAARFTICP